jgi:AAA15 family ATPase/GTPase
MESAKITIRNYRNIPYNNPLTFEVNEGITFILGVNNIGKSNSLKFFYEFRGVFNNGYGTSGNKINVPVYSPTYANIKNQNSESNTIEVICESIGFKYSFILNPLHSELADSQANVLFQKSPIYDDSTKNFDWRDLGILHNLFTNHLYFGSFRTTIGQTTGDYFDVLIGERFIQQWDIWANGMTIAKRNKVKKLEEELKELFGFEKFEIRVASDKRNLIINTEDGSFNLDELGGGISHFILVLGNALIKEPDFILIDEPENALHPKMQELFIRTLASKAKIGLIATSHSIGLARSTADKIFSLVKDENKRLKLVEFGNNYKPSVTSAINEMGYSQFVEIGGNHILLVEGKTEIKIFKEILRMYGIDQHFIISFLGGRNFINGDSYDELNELKRLNAKSYNVIFDSERESANAELKEDFKKFIENCKLLEFNVFPTDYYATDNYITQDALDIIEGIGKYTALSPFENINKSTNKWGKSRNWLMFREMKREDFKGTGLDKFITDSLIPLIKDS